jgi:hypothetical protein
MPILLQGFSDDGVCCLFVVRRAVKEITQHWIATAIVVPLAYWTLLGCTYAPVLLLYHFLFSICLKKCSWFWCSCDGHAKTTDALGKPCDGVIDGAGICCEAPDSVDLCGICKGNSSSCAVNAGLVVSTPVACSNFASPGTVNYTSLANVRALFLVACIIACLSDVFVLFFSPRTCQTLLLARLIQGFTRDLSQRFPARLDQ